MRTVLEVAAVVLAALAMAPALAHALELPGKRRLDRDAYFAVQTIYYPGFTLMGIAEPAAVLASLALLAFGALRNPAWWLALAAVLGLAAMQLVYWLVTHPVNRTWVKGERMGSLGSGFFSAAARGGGEPQRVAWTVLRDRWEASHVLRAALASAAFAALVLAVALD